MIDPNNKHITILGAAKSGLAAATLLKRKGAAVFVSEYGELSDAHREYLSDLSINYEENGHTDKALNCDFAVISPGIPTETPIVQRLLSLGKDLLSELEVASWFCKGKIIAITGSNGKTTVTNWIADVFQREKKTFIVAGNIGVAFSNIVEQTTDETTVILEVSSFQLDHIKWFKPDIAILLNITPDHLNRYKNSFELYAKAKYRIFENQMENDILVYGYDDPIVRKAVQEAKHKGKRIYYLPFSTSKEIEAGIFVRNNQIIIKRNKTEEVLMHTTEISLPGQHNLSNGLATAIATRASEIKNDSIRESLSRFEGVEHRLELVRVFDGVKYINDSKATNINAVWFALNSFSVPLTLILGGRDKGNDYLDLKDQIQEKVHTVIAIGEARPKIKEQLDGIVPNLIEAASLEEAVSLSRNKAKKGEIVLLSPACASFDMFDSFEHRGKVFKQCVNLLQ